MINKKIVVTTTDIDYKGWGISKDLDKILFVNKMLDNEKALVRITKEYKTYYEGYALEILKKSKNRKKDNYDNNYSLSHMENSYQDLFQYNQTKKELSNYSDKVDTLVSDNNYYNYRNKLTYSFFNNPYLKLSYKIEKTNTMAYIKKDILAPEIINKMLVDINKNYQSHGYINESFEKLIIRINEKNEIMLVFLSTNKLKIESKYYDFLYDKYNIVSVYQALYNRNSRKILERYILLDGLEFLDYQINDIKYSVSANSFLQINTNLISRIYNLISENISKKDIVLDSFSGIAAISIYISKTAKKVFAVDNDKSNNICAEKNILQNNISNVELINEDFFRLDSDIFNKVNTIICDPPRRGLDNRTLDKIVDSNIKKMIYLSCRLSTLRRDIDYLCSVSKFKVVKIYPIKNFYQTSEMETLVILERA